METLDNLIAKLVDYIFSITGFNYDITENENENGTICLEFDCESDLNKFFKLYESEKLKRSWS